jgi:hypothetical protein
MRTTFPVGININFPVAGYFQCDTSPLSGNTRSHHHNMTITPDLYHFPKNVFNCNSLKYRTKSTKPDSSDYLTDSFWLKSRIKTLMFFYQRALTGGIRDILTKMKAANSTHSKSVTNELQGLIMNKHLNKLQKKMHTHSNLF